MSLVFVLIAASVLSNFHQEVEYAAALRRQGLHRLAEVQCELLLEDQDLVAEQRVQINVELSKTLTARALNSRQPQRDQYWDLANAILIKAIGRGPASSRVLLELQLGLTKLEQAEWARREAEIRAATDQDWQSARLLIRQSIAQLKKVEESLATLVRQRTDNISSAELAELRRNTIYQLARAYRNQAITYAGNPGDQISSLTNALKYLQPIANDTLADELVWESRIDRVECYRLRGDLERASQLIADANKKNVPEKFMGRLAAEGVRLALAARNPQTALKFVQSQQGNTGRPELELARIETLVALAEDKNESKSKDYRREAAQRASRMGRLHGVYWGMRAEILVTRLSETSADTGETSLLDTTAKTLLKQGQPEKAIDAFVRGAEQAKRNGRFDEAFDYLHKAAIVNHQEKELQSAIDRFRHAAKSYPKNSKAAEAHLLAVFDAAELYQTFARAGQQSDAEKKLALYEELLTEHLRVWPDRKPANQARVWYGRLAAAKGKWQAAIDAYRRVGEGSEHAAEAYSRLGKLYQKKFARQPDGIVEARDWMKSRLSSERDQGIASVLAVELAKLCLLVTPRDYESAETNLRIALRQLDRENETDLRALLIVALAGQGDTAGARAELARLLPLPAKPLLRILQGLQPIRDARPDDEILKSIAIECVRLMQPYRDQMQATDNLLIQQTVADAGTIDQSLAAYQQFAETYPQDRRIQLRYANLLSLGRDRGAREAALKQWRLIVRQSKPRSAEWFRGKLGVAQAYFDKGEHEKSRELIELLMTLYPELGGPGLKSEFQKLLDRM